MLPGNRMYRICIVLTGLAVVAGCEAPPTSVVSATSGTSVEDTVAGRWYTDAQVTAGEPLYQMHCAVCHGVDGSATADWRKTDANGNFPPPPLNGTAHTWHHPLTVLTETIARGGAPYGGLMPGFAEVIEPDGRVAIVAYIQSWWSDDIYGRWDEINRR